MRTIQNPITLKEYSTQETNKWFYLDENVWIKVFSFRFLNFLSTPTNSVVYEDVH